MYWIFLVYYENKTTKVNKMNLIFSMLLTGLTVYLLTLLTYNPIILFIGMMFTWFVIQQIIFKIVKDLIP